MPCPLFGSERIVTCNAVRAQVTPTLYERERYCLSEDDFVNCPTLRLMLRLHRRLDESEYVALWIPPAP